MVLHYAQEVFEGLKAYRGPDGGVQLFRPMENVRRINSSCERMCTPDFGDHRHKRQNDNERIMPGRTFKTLQND